MKVLFVSIGSYGLLMPVLGAAAELARRGHTPVVLAHRRGRELVERAGFRYVEANSEGQGLNIAGWWTPLQIVPQFQLVQDALASEPADVLVVDHFAIGAIMAARASGIPVAVLGPAAYIHPLGVIPEDAPSAYIRAMRYLKMLEGYDQAAATLGLPPSSGEVEDDSPFLGDRYLLRSVPAFEVYADALPERVRFVGACLYEAAPRDEAFAEWAARDGRPIAFVQLDKLFDFHDPTAALLMLLEERGVRTAAALGPNLAKYRKLDPDSFFLREHLPQEQVLARARLAVSTGHATAVLGAIRAGVPNLIFDYGSGAPELLHCCVTAGIGDGLPGSQADEASLASLLDRILNDEQILLNTRRVQQAFAEVDSFAAIADVLEELSRSGRAHIVARATG